MRTEDAFWVAPSIGVLAGLALYISGLASFHTAMTVAFAIGIMPILLMSLVLLLVMCFGGLNNDRPPCSCGNCRSNDCKYDETLTRQENETNDQTKHRAWVYRCPKCDTLWMSEGRVFSQLGSKDKDAVPYRVQNFWGRWVPPKLKARE